MRAVLLLLVIGAVGILLGLVARHGAEDSYTADVGVGTGIALIAIAAYEYVHGRRETKDRRH